MEGDCESIGCHGAAAAGRHHCPVRRCEGGIRAIGTGADGKGAGARGGLRAAWLHAVIETVRCSGGSSASNEDEA